MPRKFDGVTKDRVVRLVEDRVAAKGCSLQAACEQVAPMLGVSWHSARHWVALARREGSDSVRGEVDLVAENAELRRQNAELRETNELLKAASAFFASELGPQRPTNDRVHRCIS